MAPHVYIPTAESYLLCYARVDHWIYQTSDVRVRSTIAHMHPARARVITSVASNRVSCGAYSLWPSACFLRWWKRRVCSTSCRNTPARVIYLVSKRNPQSPSSLTLSPISRAFLLYFVIYLLPVEVTIAQRCRYIPSALKGDMLCKKL